MDGNKWRAASPGFMWLPHPDLYFVHLSCLLSYLIITTFLEGSQVPSKQIKGKTNKHKHDLDRQVHQISFPSALSDASRAHLAPVCHLFTQPPLLCLTHPFSLTGSHMLGHNRQRVGLLLRSDEARDCRGGRDLPKKAAHSLRGFLQQGGHILRWLFQEVWDSRSKLTLTI